jgi:hypothetical protein
VGSAEDRLDWLWQDQVECLLADPDELYQAIGGDVIDLRPDEADLITDEGVLEPYGFFEQVWVAIAHQRLPA